MKAILTKVLPCTDTKPTRLVAYTDGGNRLTVSWSECDNDGRTQAQAHGYAARKLCQKMHWTGDLIGGGTPDGYVFVFADSPIRIKEAP